MPRILSEGRVFLSSVVAVLGLALAVPASAAEPPGLLLRLKPLRGADRQTEWMDVREELRTPPAGDAPLSFRAAISAITVKHIADSIRDLTVSDAQGPIPLATSDDPPVTGSDSAYRHWRAQRLVSYPVSVHYSMRTQAFLGASGPPLGMGRAGEGVAGAGVGFLFLPEGSQTTTRVSWDLSEAAPGSVGAITAGEGTVDVPGPPEALVDQWVLAGPALTATSALPGRFKGYLLGKPPFDANAMLNWSARAYDDISAWFSYLGRPPYSLFFRVLNGPAFGTGTAGNIIGGSLVTLGTNYWRNQDLDFIRNISFHEMTHSWVGHIEHRSSWFEEGLTVYVTATLPCEKHLMAPSACARPLNGYLKTYYGSEGRHWSQARIDAAPFFNEQVRSVPYGRGAIYFADLNARMLARSGGRRGLKDALEPLFAGRRNGHLFGQTEFEAMLLRELGPSAVDRFRRSQIDGTEDITPASNAFGACLERVRVTFPAEEARPAFSANQWRPRPGVCSRPLKSSSNEAVGRSYGVLAPDSTNRAGSQLPFDSFAHSVLQWKADCILANQLRPGLLGGHNSHRVIRQSFAEPAI